MLKFAHGAVQWLTTDTLSTTKAVSGLGFQPKALRFYWVGLQSATDAVSETVNERRGVGFAVSASSRRSIGTFAQDTAATSNCGGAARNDCVVCTTDGAGASDGRLDISSIDSDGFTLIVDDVTPANITVFWEAWGGSDIQVAVVGDIAEPAATGTQNYSVTGFTSDGANQVVMLAGCQSTAALNTDSATDSGLHVGFATGTGANQVTVCGNSDDASVTMDTDGYCQDGQCLSMIPIAGGTAVAYASLSAWGTDQFTLNWGARATTDRRTAFLAIKGGNWTSGSYTINGGTLNATATVSGLPYAPIGLSLVGKMTQEQTANTATNEDMISLGSGSSTTDRRSMGIRDENATGSSACEINTTIQYDQVLSFPSAAGALLSAYDINAMNSDGFQIIVDVAGGVTSEWQGYLTFGSLSVHYYPIPIDLGGVFRESAYGRRVRPMARRVPLNWYGASVGPSGELVESIAITDSFGATVVAAAILAETNAITDAFGVTMVTSAALAESHAIADAPDATKATTDALAESAAVADAPDASKSTPAAIAESHAIADAPDATQATTGALVESHGIVDAPDATALAVAALAESHAVTDAMTGLSAAVAALAETNAITDSADGEKLILGTLAESHAIADAPSAVTATDGALAESSAIADAPAASMSTTGALAESHAVADTTDGTKIQPVDFADSNAITDAHTASAAKSDALAESAAVTDDTAATAVALAALAESQTIADAPSAVKATTGALAESHAITDDTDGTKVQPVSISESNAITDAPSATMAGVGALAESAAVTDAPSATLSTTAALAETNAITDAPNAVKTTEASLSESNAITDLLTAALAYPVNLSESVSVEDLISLTLATAASIVEATTVDDVVLGAQSYFVQLTESVAVDGNAYTGPVLASIDESMTISDMIDFIRYVRIYTVNAEDRALLIVAENRLRTIIAEDRVRIVGAQDRTQEI